MRLIFLPIMMIVTSSMMTKYSISVALGGEPRHFIVQVSAADSAAVAVLLGLSAIVILMLTLAARLENKIKPS